MAKFSVEQDVKQWLALRARFDQAMHERVRKIATSEQVALAAHFYTHMMEDADASMFLSHDEVQNRLRFSMQRWIEDVFSANTADEVEEIVRRQYVVGEVHARIGIPVHLVLRGARHLKEYFSELVQHTSDSKLITDLIDLAIEIMSLAYSASHDRNSRAEEAYRLFSVAENVASEKQRQRAALLDWENQFMFEKAMGLEQKQLPRLSGSEFGLWFRHKGAHAFEGARETTLILESIRHIDEVIVPGLADVTLDTTKPPITLRELREECKSIGFHLEFLFDQNDALEAGRDALTRLLNRKFLPVVLSKQVATAQKTKDSFAVLTLDIDHFKSINDNHGHEGGDQILRQVATLLMNHSRAGDYIFRMGGEEFLILLVDVNAKSAIRKAEAMRKLIANEPFRVGEKTLQVTTSIGVSVFDGHPDYQLLLRRSDEALYTAKQQGRNQVVLS